ncbi:MAG TPA: CDP-diacylglycerol--glycerol-3-phosphate 3-phosphatidyltransferase [Clostridiales bacterium]|nr:CDP-diacylglycerol--glycerol-3-phosphate 3-phosphatidyltransferase [Clostridiales bacterium]
MTTASKITMIRVAMIPVFFVIILWDFPGHSIVALAIFIVASITDGVDGYVARKYNQISDFGKFIDPLADKLLVTAAILIFVEWGQMPSWCAMIIITREFAVTGLRLVAVEYGRVIAAAMSGKIKTAASILAICLMLTPWQSTVLVAGITINTLCVAVMVLTTVWSGVEYFVKNWEVMNLNK